MKKFFTLALLALLSFTVQAEDRKTRDFVNKGFKATTINNLEADATNWTASVSLCSISKCASTILSIVFS